ncbi:MULTISPECIES: DNA-formamidopyrimidine glycosylase [unclassified Lactococcus]|uniref:DNA-formamidopyrimidine glycosylase n=1 Tax=unclassified Lactococcus TaxID=2643510 RepID=UPI0011CA1FAA|nr:MULTISPECIES: DNA-formamidopyrimidine glycosylase [unclassified Lactococcus]MQW23535.1 DNA-formamidopyrimidine glycosylase [Lactococcus sp. dk101]TXK37864.1 DNA-formamidopyrimidine glycosylase [Lactococcus sp. dk310]TXK49278.1 DNA-formamidopyrimidine glycosylase [Lactococcus sp. dk322]
MPELPEVETVRRGLSEQIIGQKILAIDSTYQRMILTGYDDLREKLVNHVITGVSRRGKYLIFEFDTAYRLISHLRMEGKYRLEELGTEPLKHDHIFVRFDKQQLVYADVRKFGTWELIPADKLHSYFLAKKIGPEPTEEAFDEQLFAEKLKKSSKKIKPYLLEQSLVAGLGNIYVDEVLFQAKIHPESIASALTKPQVHLLHDAIIEILQKAIKLGGSSIRTYTNSFGKAGQMQAELKVYGKQNTPCPNCATMLEKIKVAGRGTHFCPNCQKLKK